MAVILNALQSVFYVLIVIMFLDSSQAVFYVLTVGCHHE